MVGLLSLPA